MCLKLTLKYLGSAFGPRAGPVQFDRRTSKDTDVRRRKWIPMHFIPCFTNNLWLTCWNFDAVLVGTLQKIGWIVIKYQFQLCKKAVNHSPLYSYWEKFNPQAPGRPLWSLALEIIEHKCLAKIFFCHLESCGYQPDCVHSGVVSSLFWDSWSSN